MLVGFKAQNHPQQVRADGGNSEVDDRALPQEDFEAFNKRFRFTVDAASSNENAKCAKHWTIAESGLLQSWEGQRVYCNPPYSDIAPWIAKAWRERMAELIVLLLPANRTEQKWWQDGIEPYRDQRSSVLSVEFLPGRLRFLKPGQRAVRPNERPPFGCVLCIWNWAAGPVVQEHPKLF